MNNTFSDIIHVRDNYFTITNDELNHAQELINRILEPDGKPTTNIMKHPHVVSQNHHKIIQILSE